MNCEQFENRVQLLLDERANLSLDIQVQQHAIRCSGCRSALMVYDCFAESPEDAEDASRAVLRRPAPAFKSWQRRQTHQMRNRILMSAAALVFVSLVLIARTSVPPPVAQIESPVIVSRSNQSPSEFVDDSAFPIDFPGLLSGVTSVDFSSLGQVDLASWIPGDSFRIVRNIPATIETIEPIYRYSTEFPVLNQWSTGIHSTIGLIQTSLPGAYGSYYSTRPKPDKGQDLGDALQDFGSTLAIDKRNLC